MMMISRVTASEMEFEPKKINLFWERVMFLKKCDWQWNVLIDLILMEFLSKEGETPVWLIGMFFFGLLVGFKESYYLRV